MGHESDELLMEQVARGSRESLEPLVRRYASTLLTYLQRMVGTKEDGVLGPVTLAKLAEKAKAEGRNALIVQYQDAREGYYKLLKTFPTFGKGWLRRVKDVTAKAIAMTRGA